MLGATLKEHEWRMKINLKLIKTLKKVANQKAIYARGVKMESAHERGAKVYGLEGREYVRQLVRLRDNETCQDCGLIRTRESVLKYNEKKEGLKGKIKCLDVHHLNGVCGKKSLGYDKLTDMDGLITLCHSCHFSRHDHSKVASGMYSGIRTTHPFRNNSTTTFLPKIAKKNLRLNALVMSDFQKGYETKYLRRKYNISQEKLEILLSNKSTV